MDPSLRKPVQSTYPRPSSPHLYYTHSSRRPQAARHNAMPGRNIEYAVEIIK